MQASRRQHYLSAMGIDCWLPRQQLPGAAPGPVYVRKTAQKAVVPQETPTSVAEHIGSTIDNAAKPSIAALMQGDLADAIPKKTTVVQAAPAPMAAPINVASFQLAFYSWVPELLIVDQVQDAGLQQQLISNLLFALGHSSLQRTQPDYFQWPLPGGRQPLDLSPHEMVFGALQRMLEQHNPTHILLMGALAAQYVLGVEEQFDAGKSPTVSPLYPNVTLLATHSSSALLEQPLLKAETWRHLQSLRV